MKRQMAGRTRSPHRLRRALAALLLVGLLLALAALGEITHVPARLQAPSGWTADVIVVPTGDPLGRRTLAAAAAFAEGRAPRMLITGTGEGEDSSRQLARLAEQHGVPPGQIWIEERSLNTWENMGFSRPILADLGAHTVLLVTSRAHARRASLVAEQQWPGVEVRVAPVEAGDTNLRGRSIEIAKTIRYGWLGRLPWARVVGLPR
jgi:uncharacterized SAM-binding protein YcdF (DUF218 family)